MLTFEFAGANHFGVAGWWAQKASDNGLIGMAFTNTSPLLAPTRSKQVRMFVCSKYVYKSNVVSTNSDSMAYSVGPTPHITTFGKRFT